MTTALKDSAALQEVMEDQANLIGEQRQRIKELEEALAEAIDMASCHRVIALNLSAGYNFGPGIPKDHEWYAVRDLARRALSPKGDRDV